jgi:hypothetical protein
MKFKLVSKLKGETLLQEKLKDFKIVVALQVAVILIVLVLKEFLKELEIPNGEIIAELIFLVVGGLYLMFLWDMLRNFTKKPIIINSTLIILLLSYAATLVAANPLYHLLAPDDERIALLIIHTALFSVEATFIFFTLLEIFKERVDMNTKLWGSACIFFMIGITFGSFYDIICLIKPGSLGVDLAQGLPNYMECIYYSLSVIGGIDSEYQNATLLVKKIAIVESVWSNIFIVLLVGRLLSKD